jgi:hypothetical protein
MKRAKNPHRLKNPDIRREAGITSYEGTCFTKAGEYSVAGNNNKDTWVGADN